MQVITLTSFFAILFTGNMPRDIFNFVVGTLRRFLRANAYTYPMRDEYLPFSTK